MWSLATKSLVSTCNGHTNTVMAVAPMPDGQRFLSGANDYTIRVWLLDGTPKNTFWLHTDQVFTLVALPDNQHALSASRDHTVKLFNVNDGAVLRNFKHHTNDGRVAWRCCPTDAASSAARTTKLPSSLSTASRRRST